MRGRRRTRAQFVDSAPAAVRWLAWLTETVLGGNVPILAWTEGVKFEEHAKVQLKYVAMLPIIFRHVAVMPDVTPECGSTVGSVIPTVKAVES